jgi:predicted DNA-binding protein
MARKALSEGGGEAPMVAVRFPHEQVGRVLEMANAAGLTRSEFVRQAVEAAIERAETDGRAPPDQDL